MATATATKQTDELKNLRIVPSRNYRDTYGTGDSQAYTTYEVRRDYFASELKFNDGRTIPYADSVIASGVTMETFNSEVNAAIFINAIADREYLVDNLNTLKKSVGYVISESRKWFTPIGKKEAVYPFVKRDNGYDNVRDLLTDLEAAVIPVNLTDLLEGEYVQRERFTAAYALMLAERAEYLIRVYNVHFSRENPEDGVNYPISLGAAIYGLINILFTINQHNKFV